MAGRVDKAPSPAGLVPHLEGRLGRAHRVELALQRGAGGWVVGGGGVEGAQASALESNDRAGIWDGTGCTPSQRLGSAWRASSCICIIPVSHCGPSLTACRQLMHARCRCTPHRGVGVAHKGGGARLCQTVALQRGRQAAGGRRGGMQQGSRAAGCHSVGAKSNEAAAPFHPKSSTLAPAGFGWRVPSC